MIKTIRYELLKIISDKGYIILFAALFLAVCGYTALSPLEQYFSVDCYSELRALTSDKSHAEIGDKLEETLLKYRVYDALTWGDSNAELFADNRTAKYVAEYKDCGLNSVEIMGRLTLFQREYEQFLKVNEYEEFLKNAENNEVFSMFRDENSFSYKSLSLTEKAYARLKDTRPVYFPSEGINRTLNNLSIEIAVIVIAFFGAKKLFFDEKQVGKTLLSMSYINGRKTHALSKIFALAVLIFFGSLVFTFSAAIVNEIRFGLVDLSAAIQSVEGYYTSVLGTSVLGAMMLSIFSKAMVGLCAALFVSAMSIVLKLEQFLRLSAVLFAALNYGAYYIIDANSFLALFKYASVFSLFDTAGIYGGCTVLNVFGNAIFSSLFSWIICVVLTPVLGFVTVYFYEKGCSHNSVKSGVKRRMRVCVNLTANELYRIFIARKGAAFAMIFAVGFVMYLGGITRLLDLDDMQYSDYIRKIGGEITTETYEFIESEKSRYSAINEQMNELSRRFSGGEISETDFNAAYSSYSKQLMGERSLLRVSSQLETVSTSKSAQLIYDTGYNKLLRRSAYPLVFSLLFAAILIPPIYGEDSKTGFGKIIVSTRNGGNKLFSIRLVITVLIAAISTALCCFSQFLYIELLYGWDGINAPVQSLAELVDFPLNISVGGFFLLVNIVCSAGAAAIGAGILPVSRLLVDKT